MAGDLVVRIFFYGLVLLVPDYGADGDPNQVSGYTDRDAGSGQSGEVDDRLTVLLPDARHRPHRLPAHHPKFLYCSSYADGSCEQPDSKVLAQDLPFESLDLAWVTEDFSEVPLSGGVVWHDGMGGRPGRKHRWPTSEQEAGDFDWTIRVRDVLGPGFQVTPKKECLWAESGGCPAAVASARFRQGDVQVCHLVSETPLTKKGPRKVEFSPWSAQYPRAIAELVLLELRRPLTESAGLKVKGSAGWDVTLSSQAGDPCGESGRDRCFNVAVVNLPPSSEESYDGGRHPGHHFRLYYDLFEIQPEPSHFPIPRIAEGKTPGVQSPKCPGMHSILEKWQIRIPDDLAICPVGTP